jgi:hypothetical protein
MNPAAIRTDKNTVRNINVNGALFAAIRTFFVTGAPHQIAENLLLLLLDHRRHRNDRLTV